MFTGLIEEIGSVKSLDRKGNMIFLTIGAKTILDDVKTGDSIAINGVCLTVTSFDSSSFTVQAVNETVRRTNLEKLNTGNPVNLERALKLTDRLGGHMVQGHVDGTGKIVSKVGNQENTVFGIATDAALERYIVEKGSVALDGVSLTVTNAKKGVFGVSIIAHTLGVTTLSHARVGDTVNIETDMVAKYIEKLMSGDGSVTIEHLRKLGY